MQLFPENIQIIGNELAILWSNGIEDYFHQEYLRKYSPSADNLGETDIFGNTYGKTSQTDFQGITILGWEYIGNYALKINFSDGHSSGLYSWNYLSKLAKQVNCSH